MKIFGGKLNLFSSQFLKHCLYIIFFNQLSELNNPTLGILLGKENNVGDLMSGFLPIVCISFFLIKIIIRIPPAK
jgi:hypothetical protein